MAITDQDLSSSKCETMAHIMNVSSEISLVILDLLARSMIHDVTKLMSPEVECFAEFTKKLAAVTYGSDEYKNMLAEMKPTLQHHYSMNSHHPEHHANGIDDMTIMDVVEMFCDWRAATHRHNDGNIMKSIDINEKRFNINPQLANILRNTARHFSAHADGDVKKVQKPE